MEEYSGKAKGLGDCGLLQSTAWAGVWALGVALLVVQGERVIALAVDLPKDDAWEFVGRIDWTERVTIEWLLAPHNEHRILFARLLTWMHYKVGQWNVVAEVAFNYVLYVLLVAFFVSTQRRLSGSRTAYLFVPIFATPLLYENLVWGFQSPFHCVMLFYFAAMEASVRKDGWFLAAVPLACAAMLTLGCGFGLSLGVLASFLHRSVVEPERRTSLVASSVTLLAVAPMLYPYSGNGHIAKTMPWKEEFWQHFGQLVVSSFGYLNISGLGLAATMLSILTLLAACSQGFRGSAGPGRVGVSWACCSAAGLIACLASISVARASLGAEQGRSSRYLEVGIFLIPLCWAAGMRLVSEWRPWLRRLTAMVALGLLYLPLVPTYFFDPYTDVQAGADLGYTCVQARLAGKLEAAGCEHAFPAPIPDDWLGNGVAAGFSFARRHGSYTAGLDRMPNTACPSTCNLDAVNQMQVSRTTAQRVEGGRAARFSLWGWAYFPDVAEPPTRVLLINAAGGEGRTIWGRIAGRADVATAYKEPKMGDSGISVVDAAPALAPGRYRVYFERGRGEMSCACDTEALIEILPVLAGIGT